jgi:hypothetical protein
VPHTELFTENYNVIARLDPASQTVEQNTARFDMGLYDRIFILLHTGLLATNATLNVDVEQHTAASGGSTKNVTGKSITELTDADDNKLIGIELTAEELDIAGGYHYVSVEVIPAVGAAIFGLLVFAGDASYKPVSVTNFDEIVN